MSWLSVEFVPGAGVCFVGVLRFVRAFLIFVLGFCSVFVGGCGSAAVSRMRASWVWRAIVATGIAWGSAAGGGEGAQVSEFRVRIGCGWL